MMESDLELWAWALQEMTFLKLVWEGLELVIVYSKATDLLKKTDVSTFCCEDEVKLLTSDSMCKDPREVQFKRSTLRERSEMGNRGMEGYGWGKKYSKDRCTRVPPFPRKRTFRVKLGRMQRFGGDCAAQAIMTSNS
jgi:hypothetical protein